MDFPNCSLVNASPVNNGPATIYQTAVTGPNGQPADLFSSGMQYPSKISSEKQKTAKNSFRFVFQQLLVQQPIQLLVFNYNLLLLIRHYQLNIRSTLQQQSILICQQQHSFQVHWHHQAKKVCVLFRNSLSMKKRSFRSLRFLMCFDKDETKKKKGTNSISIS